MPKYLNACNITEANYGSLLDAIKLQMPPLEPLLISNRTDEAAGINEVTAPLIHIVTKMGINDYINPYYALSDRNRGWAGFIDLTTGKIQSIHVMRKYLAEGHDPANVKKVNVAISDIRNFVYDIEQGNTLNIYDLFAGKQISLLPDELLELKRFSSEVFNIQSIYSRYVGALDSITARVIHYKAFIISRANALANDPSTDVSEFKPVSFDVPTNCGELKELFTMFINTWVRANMVSKYIIDCRNAKTPEENRAVENDLILRWWRKENPNRFTDIEMFSFAMRNMMIKNIVVTAGVRSIRYEDFITNGNEFYPTELPSTVAEHHDLIDRLSSIIDAMIMVTNDIRARVGTIPISRNLEKRVKSVDPVRLVEKIILG